MRCCVPDCKNDSRHISKSQGITFHAFPTEPALRTAWLKALGKEAWEPRDRSAVCSEHFLCEDLYETNSGLRKVRMGAVPLIVQDSNICDAYGESVSLKVCTEDRLPQKLCTECVQRLLNCNKFRLKSLRANSLLLEVIKKQNFLTEENIKTINRYNNQLTSSLVKRSLVPNNFDYYMEYTEPETIIDEKQCDIEIKEENEIFLTEVLNEKQDLNEQNNIDCDQKDYSEKEFSLDNDNYSTDDNLPLEICKTKKSKKRKIKDKKPPKEVKKVKKVKEQIEPKIDRRRKPFLNDDLNETLFTITDLSFEEQIAEIAKRRESSNYKNSVFKCTDCFKGFLDEDAFSCKQCTYVTTHRQTARLHERWHKGTKYRCPHCQDEFV
ncbi:hypothetical protein HF086_003208 [Spodoptera exigua]|uniref:THAP-type domain-containing protein n=1 Tax=Spodoptera exigua TaxID=7107 RepID=A0A922MFG8_SPOEX|nr:hypothetical protein HF086_003208 [Spodoptera exigua]